LYLVLSRLPIQLTTKVKQGGLGEIHARWQEKVAQRMWSLLEAHVGKLG